MEERLLLAKLCFDGNEDKALALLQLLDMVPTSCKMPDVKMDIPNEYCAFCAKDGTCLLNFPDSAPQCKGECENASYINSIL